MITWYFGVEDEEKTQTKQPPFVFPTNIEELLGKIIAAAQQIPQTDSKRIPPQLDPLLLESVLASCLY